VISSSPLEVISSKDFFVVFLLRGFAYPPPGAGPFFRESFLFSFPDRRWLALHFSFFFRPLEGTGPFFFCSSSDRKRLGARDSPPFPPSLQEEYLSPPWIFFFPGFKVDPFIETCLKSLLSGEPFFFFWVEGERSWFSDFLVKKVSSPFLSAEIPPSRLPSSPWVPFLPGVLGTLFQRSMFSPFLQVGLRHLYLAVNALCPPFVTGE